jgi:hypothetical protein
MRMETSTLLLVVVNVFLAAATVSLAVSTWQMVREAKEGSIRQLGVQTWLHMASRFDSEEIRRARARLAEQLERYDPSLHEDVAEEVLDLFEDIGTVHKLGLMNRQLADSTFSYYASRWWEVAKTYIYQERERNRDEEIFRDFEALAKEMRRPSERLDSLDLKQFLEDEKGLAKP